MNQNRNEISEEEPICRYLFHSNNYSASNGRVRYNAFLPLNGETSVFRIKNLSEEEVWDIGQREIADRRNKELKARGDVIASSIYEVGLGLEPEISSHHLHANIINWPKVKSEQILIARKVADSAELHLNPNS
ncbi:MAG: hypothetical protein Q8P24_16650 [Desulfobacterales bacterium]|nr:hypothetical protein [Desulfobacterales bacterium]